MDAVDVLLNGFSVVKDNPKVVLAYFLLSVLSFASFAPMFLVLLSNRGTIVNITHTNSFTPGIEKLAEELILSGIFAALLALLVSLLIQPLVAGMIVEVGLESASRKHVPLSSAFEKAKSRYAKLVWTNFAVSVIESLGGLAIIIFIAVMFVAGLKGPALVLLILIGVVAAIAYTLLAAILLYLAIPAVMAESRSGIDALKMSYNITRKDKLGILAIFIVVGIIYFFASAIIGNIMGASGSKSVTAFSTSGSIAVFAIFMLLSMLIDGFVYSALLVTSGLMYMSYKNGVKKGMPKGKQIDDKKSG
jgi:hypothetical protein